MIGLVIVRLLCHNDIDQTRWSWRMARLEIDGTMPK
jgi:hypothetical protein